MNLSKARCKNCKKRLFILDIKNIFTGEMYHSTYKKKYYCPRCDLILSATVREKDF